MSQAELAKLMGYADKSMIAKIEAGKVDLTQSKIILAAKALKTTPEYLFDNDVSYEDEQLWEAIKSDPRKLQLAMWIADLDADTLNRVDKILTAAFER